jgi:hypothetical protein
MSDDTIRINTKGLDQLIRALGKRAPVARVGVLGAKASRATPPQGGLGGTKSNAEIGAAHEFGTSKLPIRSFLRMPISEKLESYLESSGAFGKETLNEVMRSGSIVPWLTKVGIVAESIVADAFSSGGFGKWQPSNMKYKKNAQTLVETQQLRNSITSDIKE